jgi:predicted ATPase
LSFPIHPKEADEVNNEIKLHHLSSGEKQIVSLFSHLYLSGGKKYFVLIDEPELSLSVPWQRKFLLDIKNADFCSGLVAVTHSPFIYDNELKKYAHGVGEFTV